MMTKTTHCVLSAFFLLTSSFLFAQTTIAEYPLTTDLAPSIEDVNVSATDMAPGPNVGGLTPSADGAFATGWPQVASLDENRYIEITISPNAGYEMNITDINFGYRRSGSSGPLAYELYWSTDGIFANSTRLDSVGIPNDANNYVGSLSGLDIDIADGETIYLRWYAYDASGFNGSFRIDVNNTNLQVEGTVSVASTGTVVAFDGTENNVNEGDGTTGIDVSILNEDATATSVDVVLISGDASKINGYTTQTLTFPGGSSANETLTVTLTDDAVCDPNEEFVFELQNATGGDNAGIVSPSQFTLTVVDNDQTENTAYTNDFESNNLNGWNESIDGEWTTSTTGVINGTYSMKHNVSGDAGNSAASISLYEMDLEDYITTWRFQMKNGNWDPSGDNNFWVYLASEEEEILDEANTIGYAVGINMTDINDSLKLYRIDAGNNVVPLLEAPFNWDAANTVGIEVVREQSGEWTLRFDADGGFDNLVSGGSVVDNTHTAANYFGPVFNFTSTRAGEFWLDDVSITQQRCVNTYYSQTSGNFTDAIWDIVPSGSAGSAEINRYNNFVIQNGHSVALDGDVETKDVDIESGGTLDLANALHTLSLSGSFDNLGTLTAGDGKVRFFGSGGTNSISGTNAFFDLEVDLIDDVLTLNNNTDVWGTLTLNNGEVDVNGNVLTLKSDAATTAAVAPVANGSVNGNVTVERYIQNGINSWRNLGASVSGATLQDWNDHFTTTGFPGSDYPNWPTPANRFPNIKSYDETQLGDREIGWQPASSINNTIEDGQGFWMYIGGSELPNTVDVEGTLITGEQTLNLDYTPDLGAYHDGWNMVSNMYAATIDWDSPDFGRTGLEDGIWIWNQDVQQYGSYISGISTHSVTNEIAHSQSFWVHANAASPTLTFRESIKTSNNNADWIKSMESEPAIARIKLEGNGYYDETVLAFNDEATLGYEGTHDAMKFYSVNEEVPGLATVSEGDDEDFDVAINSVDLPEGASFSIPMKTAVGVAGEYVLSISEIENIPSSACIYVEDLHTGSVMLLEENAEMLIELDTAQMETPRFIIHVSGPIVTEKQDNTCNAANEGWITAEGAGDGPWTYTWRNSSEEIIQVSESIFSADTLANLAADAYTVEVTGSSDVCENRSKQFVISEPPALSASIDQTAPACNAGNEGEIFMVLTGGNGTWDVELYKDGELVETTDDIENAISFGELSADSYTVMSTNNCGTVESVIDLTDPNMTHADFVLPEEEISLMEGGTIELTNTSQNALLYYWEMGDGTGYFTTDVTHTYTQPGEYSINLYSMGTDCEDMISKSLTVTDSSVDIEELSSDEIEVWFDGQQVIIEHDFAGREMDIRVVNILGKTMFTTQSFQDRTTLPMTGQGYAPGVYLVHLSIDDVVETHKIVLNK